MFDKDLDILIDTLFPLDWDKKNYKFNREEKDMHPYTIKYSEKEMFITHNILGIDKKDLKITNESENGKTFISIKGKTKLSAKSFSELDNAVKNFSPLTISVGGAYLPDMHLSSYKLRGGRTAFIEAEFIELKGDENE